MCPSLHRFFELVVRTGIIESEWALNFLRVGTEHPLKWGLLMPLTNAPHLTVGEEEWSTPAPEELSACATTANAPETVPPSVAWTVQFLDRLRIRQTPWGNILRNALDSARAQLPVQELAAALVLPYIPPHPVKNSVEQRWEYAHVHVKQLLEFRFDKQLLRFEDASKHFQKGTPADQNYQLPRDVRDEGDLCALINTLPDCHQGIKTTRVRTKIACVVAQEDFALKNAWEGKVVLHPVPSAPLEMPGEPALRGPPGIGAERETSTRSQTCCTRSSHHCVLHGTR